MGGGRRAASGGRWAVSGERSLEQRPSLKRHTKCQASPPDIGNTKWQDMRCIDGLHTGDAQIANFQRPAIGISLPGRLRSGQYAHNRFGHCLADGFMGFFVEMNAVDEIDLRHVGKVEKAGFLPFSNGLHLGTEGF